MERYWQIDFARGISVIFMIFYNYAFSLSFLSIYHIDLGWLFWFVLPRIVGGSFIFISGISLSLSIYKQKKISKNKYFIRGVKIFSIGLFITFITFMLFPDMFIIFGILHLIGISIILGFYLRKLGKWIMPLGASIIIIGIIINDMTIFSPFLVWLGIPYYGFSTLDYFPLFPWLGVFLVGMYFGSEISKKIKPKKSPFFSSMLCTLGRHSLLIYLIHQPVLIAILFLSGFNLPFL